MHQEKNSSNILVSYVSLGICLFFSYTTNTKFPHCILFEKCFMKSSSTKKKTKWKIIKYLSYNFKCKMWTIWQGGKFWLLGPDFREFYLTLRRQFSSEFYVSSGTNTIRINIFKYLKLQLQGPIRPP